MFTQARYFDGFVGLDRAGVFTRAATDAQVVVQRRQTEIVTVGNRDHSLGRAMFGAGGAIGAVGDHHAFVFVEMRLADFREVFGSRVQQINCAVRADLAAALAIEIAEGNTVIHVRFHQSAQAVFEKGRLQHTGRTFTDAQVTGGATVEKSFDA